MGKPPILFNLKSCISTPLLSDGRLIGVLSLYSTELNGFNDDHRRIIEVVSAQIAHTFSRAIEFESSSRRDILTGLPHLEQLATLIHSTYEIGPNVTQRHALLFIDVLGLNGINLKHGRSVGDEVLRHVYGILAPGCESQTSCFETLATNSWHFWELRTRPRPTS